MRKLDDKHGLLPPLWKGLDAERRGMGLVLDALIPIDEKEAYLDYGYSSLYLFLVDHCRLSNGAAFRRKHCVVLIRKHPKLLPLLKDGTLSLSNLTFARNIIKDDNVDEIIALIANKTQREVEKIVASIDPKARPRSGIRKLREGSYKEKPITQLDAHLYQFTAVFDSELHRRVEHVQEMLRRMNPANDPDVLFREAIIALEEKLEKKLFAKTDRPRAEKPSKDPARISNATKRKVYQRDGGQCTFVSESGRRCSSREFLEFHHVKARAHVGDGSPDNVCLLCRAHHKQQTEKTFGREQQKEKIALRKKTSREHQQDASPDHHQSKDNPAAPSEQPTKKGIRRPKHEAPTR